MATGSTIASSVAGAAARPSAGGASIEAHASRFERTSLVRFGVVAAQVALLAMLTRWFHLENPAFERRVMPAIGVGFVIHHFLPLRARLPFFSALSIGVLLWAMGMTSGLLTLGMGVALIALCHVPIPFWWRVALVLGAATAMGVARSGAWAWAAESLSLAPVWPILGSMFMFRLIVYLYDLKSGAAPFSPARSLAYFFMVPNVCFPLFPVVDYKTFCRNYYNDDPIRIYQVGAKWIFRGVVQLLLYRWIYRNEMIDPADVATLGDVWRFVLTTFLLYLRISGTFHIIVGVLHLFGFNLPETHHLYFLSTSFTDFWRRINIYWKDFLQKVVFYPLYFRLKRFGEGRAVVLATLLAFLTTLVLHSYQWFWIRGKFPIRWNDAVFWLGLGALVIVNMRWEARRGRRRTLRPRRTVGAAARTGLACAAMFLCISLLWTVWYSPDLEQIRLLARASTNASWRDGLAIVATLAIVGVAGAALGMRSRENTEGARVAGGRGSFRFWPSALGVLVPAAALLALGVRPPSPDRFGKTGEIATLIATRLRQSGLNVQDFRQMERGYYEDLGNIQMFNSELWRRFGGKPVDWVVHPPLSHPKDRVWIEFKPSASVKGQTASYTTNSFGMRDREYEERKPAGTHRMLLVGSSHDAGSGVNDAEAYENLVEDRLNAERTGDGVRYEILNFSVPALTPIQRLALIEAKGPRFETDTILYGASFQDLNWAPKNFDLLLKHGSPELKALFAPILERARVREEMSPKAIERALLPYSREILSLVYRRLAEHARARGVNAAVILLEIPSDRLPVVGANRATVESVASMAREAGLTLLDMRGTFAGVSDPRKLYIAPYDTHTNAEGHRMLAARLYDLMLSQGVVPPSSSARPAPGATTEHSIEAK